MTIPESLIIYGEQVTAAVLRRSDGGLFVAADAFASFGGDRVGQMRLIFSEAEAKTFISALRYAMAYGEGIGDDDA